VFVHTGAVDNVGNDILAGKGISQLELKPFAVKFALDLEASGFTRNQTVCMAIDVSE
jgi:hypothetical protein